MLKDIVENYEKKGGLDTETIQAECPLCRQMVVCKATPDMLGNRDILKELAMEWCSCDEAKKQTKRMQRLEQMDQKIEKMLGEKSLRPIDEDAYTTIKEMAKLVCFDKIHRTTIHLTKIEKVTLSKNADGQLIMNREFKNITGETV